MGERRAGSLGSGAAVRVDWTAEVNEVFRIHLFGVITALNDKFELDAKQNYPQVEFTPSMLNEVHAVRCHPLVYISIIR